jgi:hypothetical protein
MTTRKNCRRHEILALFLALTILRGVSSDVSAAHPDLWNGLFGRLSLFYSWLWGSVNIHEAQGSYENMQSDKRLDVCMRAVFLDGGCWIRGPLNRHCAVRQPLLSHSSHRDVESLKTWIPNVVAPIVWAKSSATREDRLAQAGSIGRERTVYDGCLDRTPITITINRSRSVWNLNYSSPVPGTSLSVFEVCSLFSVF